MGMVGFAVGPATDRHFVRPAHQTEPGRVADRQLVRRNHGSNAWERSR
jgi:hypothetical protein